MRPVRVGATIRDDASIEFGKQLSRKVTRDEASSVSDQDSAAAAAS
jgi:hypothetical protein